MKELSIEQKAQRYEDVIQRANNILEGKCKNSFVYSHYNQELIKYLFRESEESEDEEIRKEIKKDAEAWYKEHYEGSNPQGRSIVIGAYIDGATTWFKKQGGQKPLDKVEPKFHEGDWVVYEETTYQIHNIGLKKYYECLRTDGTVHIFDFEYIDSKSHLWTIQDAKDGDALTWDDTTCVVLFKNVKNNKCFISYCFANDISFEMGTSHYIEDCHPATKEQRELLFQKMKEAGYEFDFGKKELKEIEQKPVEWSLHYGKNETAEKLIALAECLEMDGDCLFNGLSGNDYGKFLRVLAKELTEIKLAEWSEEDEKTLNSILSCIKHCQIEDTEARYNGNRYVNPKRYEPISDWLVSIKYRHTWKPTKDQMKALEWQVANTSQDSWQYKATKELLKQLKQL